VARGRSYTAWVCLACAREVPVGGAP
jgi:hypothetical protein